MALKIVRTERTPEPEAPVVPGPSLPRAENAAASYRKVEAAILALPAEDVGRVTCDVGVAAATALGALPNLLRFRADIEATFLQSAAILKKLDDLQDYALAAVYADIRAGLVPQKKQAPPLLMRAKPMRDKLIVVAEALVQFGLFDATLVPHVRRGQGHLDLAEDLMALAAHLNASWDVIENKVPFEQKFLLDAAELGAHLVQALSVDRVGNVKAEDELDWSVIRARAFRLLMREYDELRRVIGFLRYAQGDANDFAPALHVNARKGKRVGKGRGETRMAREQGD